MERLTKRISNPEGKNIIAYTMGDYEDTTAGEMTSSDVRTVLRALANYEDLEEQGLLLKLPCKVGDTMYYTHPEHLGGKIEEYTVTGFVFDKRGCQIRTYSPKGFIIYFYLEFIGKTVFLTQAEAEEALGGVK